MFTSSHNRPQLLVPTAARVHSTVCHGTAAAVSAALSVCAVFAQFDLDGNGSVGAEELHELASARCCGALCRTAVCATMILYVPWATRRPHDVTTDSADHCHNRPLLPLPLLLSPHCRCHECRSVLALHPSLIVLLWLLSGGRWARRVAPGLAPPSSLLLACNCLPSLHVHPCCHST